MVELTFVTPPPQLPLQALQAAAREKMELALQQQNADSAVSPSPLGENHGELNEERKHPYL